MDDGAAKRAQNVEWAFCSRRRTGQGGATTGLCRVVCMVRAECGGRWMEVWSAEDDAEQRFYRLSTEDGPPYAIGSRAAGEPILLASDYLLGGLLGGPTGPPLFEEAWREYARRWFRSTRRRLASASPTEHAASQGDLEAVRALLAARPCADDLAAALMCAAARGHVAVATLLLDHGADPNARVTGTRGATPLHPPADLHEVEAVRLLLARGADPNARDDWGVTPLMFAVMSAIDGTVQAGEALHTETAAALIAHGADASVEDNLGRSLLNDPEHYSAERYPWLEPLVRLWRDASAEES